MSAASNANCLTWQRSFVRPCFADRPNWRPGPKTRVRVRGKTLFDSFEERRGLQPPGIESKKLGGISVGSSVRARAVGYCAGYYTGTGLEWGNDSGYN